MKYFVFVTLLLSCTAVPVNAQMKQIPFAELEERLDDRSVKRYFFEDKPYAGKATERYEYEQTTLEYHLENGYIQKLFGWKFDGSKEREYAFKDGIPHGKLIAYYRNGQKYFEETYIDGLLHGKQYGWYRDGSLRLQTEFINGVEIMRKEYPNPQE